AFERGASSLKEIKGIAFRDEGKVIVTPPRPLIQNLDEIPFPARHLLPMDKYTVLGQQTVIGHVMSSRGCPFRCIFCSSSRIFGRVWRGRSPKNVVDEIEELCDKWKAKHIEFADDTFTLNMKRAEEISKEIIRRGLDIFWACGARVDTLRRELVQWMKKAGCHVIYIGVESGSQRILNLLKKGIRLEQVIKAVKWLKEAGMEITASYVIGTPGETKEEVERTIKFAVKLDTDFAQFTAMTPYPGTEVYEYAKREGLLLTNDWSKFTTIKPVMRTKELSAEEIEKLVSRAYRKFYLRPKFLWRQLKKGRLPLIFLVLKNYLSGKKASPSS
ncbi:MAG TPA: radical SAM protein, partial [Candidatus Methanomethylia archaeon]|nr:radical SAM protein [Candidatus Methanomethylicia archaeon]